MQTETRPDRFVKNLHKLYRVPNGIRLLAGAGSLAVLASLPALLSAGSNLATLLVLGCGIFSASVALLGRPYVAPARSGLRT